MRKFVISVIVGLIAFSLFSLNSYAGMIAPDLLTDLNLAQPDEEFPVIITFTDEADITVFKDEDKKVKKSKILKALKDTAIESQKDFKALLKDYGVDGSVKDLWIINALALKTKADVIWALAEQPGVEEVYLDRKIGLPQGTSPCLWLVPEEWNIDAVRAGELWGLGYTGEGVVVATMDTGVDPYHPDIAPAYRGGPDSWYDPNGQHGTPADTNGHGTWVTGVLVGGNGGGSAIGIAPDAKWIAVKIFDDSDEASLSGIHQGYQWLLAPGDNPENAPDIVNNSWVLEGTENQCDYEFADDIAALAASEIAVVFSAGNSGPDPSTSMSPANDPGSFPVGASDPWNYVTSTSARGPSACGGSSYPVVVAPGAYIYTTDLTFGGLFLNSYTCVAGTSFAAPHVAGAMALLLQANPSATVSELESALTGSAYDLDPLGPDDDSGYGVIDIVEAYNMIGNPPQCADADGDLFYAQAGCGTAQDCDDKDAAINPGAGDSSCNGVDENCSGTADDGYVSTSTNCGVGACASAGQLVCQGGVETDTCSPGTPGVEGPYGDATCSDTLDNDCDALTDGADSDCEQVITCIDTDGDGYGVNGDPTCPNPGIDCNDGDPSVNPGASDSSCNGVDENCDGTPDNNYVPTATTCGVGECASSGQLICLPGGSLDDTCAPGTPGVEGPFGDATCSDTLDNDCDALTDGADSDCEQVITCIDTDGDGYGVNGDPTCPNLGIDCNDGDPSINPGASDSSCNGVDENCSGTADDGYVSTSTNCGVGECAALGQLICQGGVETDTCSPGTPGVEGPFGDATCSDTLDNDCDALTDGADSDCEQTVTCIDADGDGYGVNGDPTCPNPGVDCNDGNAGAYPGAPEVKHDGIDQDCNGYDLTIDITRARYESRKDKLTVWASSDLGNQAALQVTVGLQAGGNITRALTWNSKRGRWEMTIKNFVSSHGSAPDSVTVFGPEGSENSPVDQK